MLPRKDEDWFLWEPVVIRDDEFAFLVRSLPIWCRSLAVCC